MARPAIKLNGVVLPPQMIAAEAQHHPARTPAEAFQAAARALIIRTLLLEEARRQGLEAAPVLIAEGKRELPEEAQIRLLLEHCVPIGEVSEQACRSFYDSHGEQFRSPDLVEASHILFAADPRDGEASGKALAAAQAVLDRLAQQPGLFEAMAGEHSDCASKSSGGRLGQLAPGDTVPEFEAALFALEQGKITAVPVTTRFGVHIIRMDARIAGQALPFSYVQEKIAAFLGEQEWRRQVARLIDRLVNAAQIEGIDMQPARAVAA